MDPLFFFEKHIGLDIDLYYLLNISLIIIIFFCSISYKIINNKIGYIFFFDKNEIGYLPYIFIEQWITFFLNFFTKQGQLFSSQINHKLIMLATSNTKFESNELQSLRLFKLKVWLGPQASTIPFFSRLPFSSTINIFLKLGQE